MRLFLLSLIVLNLFCLPAWAARPLATEDPGVCGKGVSQLEVDGNYSWQDGSRDYALVVVPIYGFADNLEFSIELPYKLVRPAGGLGNEGFSDANLVLKTLFINECPTNPAFLIKSVVKLASGNQPSGLGSGDVDLGFVAVAGKAFGPLMVNANLGYTFVGRKANPTLNNYILYAISSEYFLTDKFKLVSELYGEQNHHYDTGSFIHRASNSLIGMTYQLGGNTIVDVAVRSSSATAGLTLNI